MWHRAADMRILLLFPVVALLVTVGLSSLSETVDCLLPEQPSVHVSADGTQIELLLQPLPGASYSVRRATGGPVLMGSFREESDRVIFTPALPLPAGQEYHFECIAPSGLGGTHPFRLPAARAPAPQVSLRPVGVALPANALRLYLHFTQPMEQGVFLERLRLLDDAHREIHGPFREAELWSPDGTRLTLWFHPGRQKTGVNLRLDEGPVLHPNRRYHLEISGNWRSTAGIPLGADAILSFQTGPEDHTPPEATALQLQPVFIGTTAPLHVTMPEPLDPAMLATALHIRAQGDSQPLAGRVEAVPNGLYWSFFPESEWQPGTHTLHILPELEDLAGNSFARPFEVDIQAPASVHSALAPIPFSPSTHTR